jgi:hypothetical protein
MLLDWAFHVMVFVAPSQVDSGPFPNFERSARNFPAFTLPTASIKSASVSNDLVIFLIINQISYKIKD